MNKRDALRKARQSLVAAIELEFELAVIPRDALAALVRALSPPKRTIRRSARTGKFVTKDKVAAAPDTTVTERRR